jgi:feruloyl esterase
VARETIDGVQAELAANPSAPVTVTGHSLGGSLASLAAMSLAGSGINATTYTFGQPRTGNPAYADFVDQTAPAGRMFRVTHGNDGVPQVVTTHNGFQHHSTEFWQEDQAVAEGTFQCVGQEPPVRSRRNLPC